MPPDLPAPYEHLTFMSPLSHARAERLVAFLAEADPATVADLGCGWGELLLRVVAGAPHARGTGFDRDAEAIAHGRALSVDRGLGERVTFSESDARDGARSGAEAVICIGASQIWREPDDDVPCDYAKALAALRAAVPRGGRVVYGEGIWSAAPTPEAVAALGGRDDEFVSLGELVDIAAAQGFMPMAVQEASLEEWDEFESGFSAGYTQWLAERPRDHPEASDVRARAADQWAGYLRGYRGVLGLAYLSLVAV